MKSITVYFENEEFEKLSKSKNKTNLTWHDFILTLVLKESEKGSDIKK